MRSRAALISLRAALLCLPQVSAICARPLSEEDAKSPFPPASAPDEAKNPLWPALEPKGVPSADAMAVPRVTLSLPKPTTEELQSLIPDAGSPTPPPPDAASDPAQVERARAIAASVVELRSWDAFGNELARGCGFFIGENGAVLTDISVVRPDFAQGIEYVTVTTGLGQSHRITGVWAQNADTGFTVLQSDATDTPLLIVNPGFGFTKEKPISIVALHDELGLTIADAWAQADDSAPGAGWLNLRGEDSPGEPGSPVLDADGRVVALVSMRVPQGKWMNFGIRIDAVTEVLGRMRKEKPQPLSTLASARRAPVQQDSRFIEAFRGLYEARPRQATGQLLKLLKPYPRSAELWALLGLGYAQLGAREEAANCNRKAVALDPTIGQAWLDLAVNQLDGQAKTAVREALEKAVVERPGDRLTWLLLGEQQLLAKQFAEAERSLLEVIKIESDFSPASYLLANVKAQQGDYLAALNAAERCVRLSPKHEQAWFFLGLLYSRQGRPADAARAYGNVVEINPAHPNAWRNLALVQRKRGRMSEAQLAFQRHQRLPVAAAR